MGNYSRTFSDAAYDINRSSTLKDIDRLRARAPEPAPPPVINPPVINKAPVKGLNPVKNTRTLDTTPTLGETTETPYGPYTSDGRSEASQKVGFIPAAGLAAINGVSNIGNAVMRGLSHSASVARGEITEPPIVSKALAPLFGAPATEATRTLHAPPPASALPDTTQSTSAQSTLATPAPNPLATPMPHAPIPGEPVFATDAQNRAAIPTGALNADGTAFSSKNKASDGQHLYRIDNPNPGLIQAPKQGLLRTLSNQTQGIGARNQIVDAASLRNYNDGTSDIGKPKATTLLTNEGQAPTQDYGKQEMNRLLRSSEPLAQRLGLAMAKNIGKSEKIKALTYKDSVDRANNIDLTEAADRGNIRNTLTALSSAQRTAQKERTELSAKAFESFDKLSKEFFPKVIGADGKPTDNVEGPSRFRQRVFNEMTKPYIGADGKPTSYTAGQIYEAADESVRRKMIADWMTRNSSAEQLDAKSNRVSTSFPDITGVSDGAFSKDAFTSNGAGLGSVFSSKVFGTTDGRRIDFKDLITTPDGMINNELLMSLQPLITQRKQQQLGLR